LISITKSILVLEDVKYELSNLLEDVNVLFKKNYATNTCYPEEFIDTQLCILLELSLAHCHVLRLQYNAHAIPLR
jgi:hypothetical protein